jgi:HJR/Mrr/RecB family endonuclease
MEEPDAFDRLLVALARRLSGRGVSVVAGGLYGGFGLALPLALSLPVVWLINLNVVSTLLAGLLILVWLTLRAQETRRRNLLEWTSDLRLLDAREFEWFVGELFRREGWAVEETGRQGQADGNVDLRLTRDGGRRIVQCKRWTANFVGVELVRGFAGTLLREGLPGSAGIFVTLSDFTPQAIEEAAKAGLTLLDGRALYSRVEKVRRPESCPTCSEPMVLDRSMHGWWFRCVRPGCGGKRDLGKDPARAVELLLAR